MRIARLNPESTLFKCNHYRAGAASTHSLLNTLFITVLCIIGLTMISPPASHADPAWGERFTLRQPDGVRVEVRIWGDEFYRVVESLDGFTLVRDPGSGEICYARLSPSGDDLTSTGVRVDGDRGESLGIARHIRIKPEVRRAMIREAREIALEGERQRLTELGLTADIDPPCTGDVEGICLIVDFSDEPATIPASDIDDYCNLPGYSGYGNNGSVRDYFFDVSDGNLVYTNYVSTSYYRALQPKSYYDDCAAPYGERARELVIEALTDLDNSGFDFSQHDSNGDGLIDAINVFYAGLTSCGWAQGLWPHSWTVSFSADGVDAYRYQITGLGSSLRLSTFCHENGHMICFWPDLYDYDHDSNGVGKYCIMCSYTSSTNPQEPCAYLKYIAGWAATTLLTTPQTGLAVPSNSNTIYKYKHPTLPNEYYLIENRQKAGRDAGLPDDGLAIWHIDTNGSNSNQNMTPTLHYEATLVQADGRWDLEFDINNGDTTDLWSAPTYVQCTPFSNPNTKWWDTSSSLLGITGISSSSASMTFDFTRMWFVKADGLGDAPFIKAAVDSTVDGEFIYLGDGTFTGSGNRNVDYNGKVITILSLGGDPDNCIIDCQDLGRGFSFGSSAGPGSILEGITVKDGYAMDGGGIYCAAGSPTIRNCILISNKAVSTGGGMFLENSSSPTVEACVFVADSAMDGSGGAARILNSDPLFDRCVFIDNWAGSSGGAVVCAESAPSFGGCTFYNNAAPLGGGMYFRLGSSTTIDSTIISFGSLGEAIHCEDATTFSINCTDIYANAGGDWIGCIAGMEVTNFNFSSHPAFCDPDNGNLMLGSFSPCVPLYSPCGSLVGACGEGCASPTGIGEQRPSMAQLAIVNYPNPFNPATTIRYTIPEPALVDLRVYGVDGRLVTTLVREHKDAGVFTTSWNGKSAGGKAMPSGIYFVRLVSGSRVETRKMVLLK